MKPIKLKSLLKEYLADENDVVENYVPIIKRDCPTAVDEFLHEAKKKRFYRGIASKKPVIYHDPRNEFRKSKQSNNISLLYSGINPDWKDIPKRYNSVVFGSDWHIANAYGSGVYLVFVTGNNPKIAFGTEDDNYDNYKKGFNATGCGIDTTVMLDSQLERLINIFVSNNINLASIEDPIELEEILDKLDEKLQRTEEKNIALSMNFYNSIAMAQSMKRLGIKKFLRTIFDPKINNIQTKPLADFDKHLRVEIWTDVPVYLVLDRYEKQLEKLLKL